MKTTVTSLYSQLKENIENDIKSGKYKTGEQLPTEFQLCQDYDVSRTTVRLALQQLELEGKIYKVQGKGTFVARPKIKQSLTTVDRFFADQMIEQNLQPVSKVLSLKVIPASITLAEQLNIEINDPVNQLIRLRYANEEPLQYEISYIPWKYAPGLADEACDGSLYQLLKEQYGVQIARTIESIEPVLLSESVSELLDVPVGAPAFYLETITYNANDQPLEYSTCYFRGDRSKFTIERQYPVNK